MLTTKLLHVCGRKTDSLACAAGPDQTPSYIKCSLQSRSCNKELHKPAQGLYASLLKQKCKIWLQHLYQHSVRCNHVLYYCLHCILVLFCEALWCSSLIQSCICGRRMQAFWVRLLCTAAIPNQVPSVVGSDSTTPTRPASRPAPPPQPDKSSPPSNAAGIEEAKEQA